jgi:hypothetical protein
MQYAQELAMTLLGRLLTAAGISLVLTAALLLIFQMDSAPPPDAAGLSAGTDLNGPAVAAQVPN